VHVHLDLVDVRFAGAALLGFLHALASEVESRGGRLTIGPVAARVARLFVLADADERFGRLLVEPGRGPRLAGTSSAR
jgi:anti-anti-sigma regulatory factor